MGSPKRRAEQIDVKPWDGRGPSHRREYKRVAAFLVCRDFAGLLDRLGEELERNGRFGPYMDGQLLCHLRCGCVVLQRMLNTHPFVPTEITDGRGCRDDEGSQFYSGMLALMDPAGAAFRQVGITPIEDWPECPSRRDLTLSCRMPHRSEFMRTLANKATDYLSVAHTFCHLLDNTPDHPLHLLMDTDGDGERV